MTAHYELHALHTAHDVTSAALAGLPDTCGVASCSNCDAPLLSKQFIPRVILLDGEDESVLCLECAGPAIKPRNPGLHFG